MKIRFVCVYMYVCGVYVFFFCVTYVLIRNLSRNLSQNVLNLGVILKKFECVRHA